jgi:predicted HTH transcriptional regulator
MTDAEFDQLLAVGEKQRIEYKGPGRATDKGFVARIARAVLAMANRRDGGLVIVGVEEVARRLKCVGLDAATMATWQARDNVETAINAYADSSASFDIEFEPVLRRCVIINVREFSDLPLLCKKGFTDPGKRGKEILRQGAC